MAKITNNHRMREKKRVDSVIYITFVLLTTGLIFSVLVALAEWVGRSMGWR